MGAAITRFVSLVPYKDPTAQTGTLLQILPLELLEMIVEQIQLQGTSFKPVALFATTCKMAFNLVYFNLRSSPSFRLSNRLFATQSKTLVSQDIHDHNKFLGREFSIRFLGHGKDQCLYFVALDAKRQPLSLLIRYNLITRTHQDIFLTNYAKECGSDDLTLMETHFYNEGVLVITKAGWTRFTYTKEGLVYKGFYSPFCKQDLNTRQIRCATIHGDTLHLTAMRGQVGSGFCLESYQFDFKSLSPGFPKVQPKTLAALAPTTRVRRIEPKSVDTQASNKTWKVIANCKQVSIFKRGKDPYAPSVATINLAKEFKRPIVRLAKDFLFVFQRSDGSSTQRGQIKCSLFYLPTGEELASPLGTLFTLPKGYELFEIALKEEEGRSTLVYITHKIDSRQGTNGGIFLVHEVGFRGAPTPQKEEERQEQK